MAVTTASIYSLSEIIDSEGYLRYLGTGLTGQLLSFLSLVSVRAVWYVVCIWQLHGVSCHYGND